LKRLPLKTLRSSLIFVPEGLLKYFPIFSGSFPELEAKFHADTFFQVFHFHCLNKSRFVHNLFSFVAVARLVAVIGWYGKKPCVNQRLPLHIATRQCVPFTVLGAAR
jgi:hypothetical protein